MPKYVTVHCEKDKACFIDKFMVWNSVKFIDNIMYLNKSKLAIIIAEKSNTFIVFYSYNYS